MTAKIQAKTRLTIGIAACLSISGALAMALSGGQSVIAQIETSQQTESREDPEVGNTQSPEGATLNAQGTQGPNTAPTVPEDPDTSPDTGDTQAPALQEDNQNQQTSPSGTGEDPKAGDIQSPEEATPTEGTQGPNTAPTMQQNQTPESSESSQESQARTENIVFVRTAEGASTGEIAGSSARFNQIVGSGRLLVNADDQVTAYYFIVSGLTPNQTLPYHFHNSKSGGTSASCEGDKAVLEDEAAGAVITPLNPIAPLQSTASGLAIIGTASSPVQLPNPVPLEDIGYLNIHATEDPASGIVCANVPLKSVAFGGSTQSETETSTPGPQETQGPNAAPILQETPPSTEPMMEESTPESSPGPTNNPPTQGPNTAPKLNN